MKLSILHIFIFILMLPASVISQNMSVQLDVNPQVETMVEQSLDFGQLIAGSGFQEIPLGSPSMGIFQVKALRTQQLMISLDADSALRHSDPAISDVISMNLIASYTDNGVNDYRLSLPFSNTMETISLSQQQNPDTVWSSTYIYVFGNIDLGFVPAGVYIGEITLTVIYE